MNADGSSIAERSLCSSVVHLGRIPCAACDPNGAAQMIRLTTPTEVYIPYQGSEGGKDFPTLEKFAFDSSLRQRELNKDLTKSPNLDTG